MSQQVSEVSAGANAVAFFGLGLMGVEMARRLAEAGYPLTVWTRTFDKSVDFVKANPGSKAVQTVSEAVERGRYLILMLTDFASIKATVASDEVMPLLAGKTVVMMMTIGIGESVELAAAFQRHGASYVECPVLGSKPVAASGSLVVMPSAPPEVLTTELKALLGVMGSKYRPISDQYGKSLAVKLALNNSIAAQMVTLADSLALIKGHGVSSELFWDILKPSVAFANYFDIKFDRMNAAKYDDPVFSVRNLLKDVSIISDELRGLGFDSSGVDGSKALLAHTIDAGYGDDDAAAVIEGVMRRAKQ
eukprot:TRINITY_DN6243_c0_g2_i1.p1 TRINITY_DN6243_c0_g2~~TRINITY_DN6243_c0_g2_i1.p1  ORF type:complete len:306 (+),score=128.96 TRINITY_DN6243_c0_g2_i1:141-1058(+)